MDLVVFGKMTALSTIVTNLQHFGVIFTNQPSFLFQFLFPNYFVASVCVVCMFSTAMLHSLSIELAGSLDV